MKHINLMTKDYNIIPKKHVSSMTKFVMEHISLINKIWTSFLENWKTLTYQWLNVTKFYNKAS